MSKVKEKRAALSVKLIDLAEAKIASEGMRAVTARYLAAEAGCAVGAIYTIFDDMNQLFMAVNMRSFAALAEQVRSALQENDHLDARAKLVLMGHQYAEFALRNTKTWSALFELPMNVESNVPAYYSDNVAALLGIIAGPMREVFPTHSDEEVMRITKTVFSSVHGVVTLGLERRLSAVDFDEMNRMIEFIVMQLSDPHSN